MPTSLKGFLNHPLYALEKQCKRNEVVYPSGLDKSIGRFKNDLVYPRSSVHRALSIEGWVRQGRSVKHEEEPCKILDQKSGNAKPEGSKSEHLYGEWQTEPYEPPSLVDVILEAV